MLQYYVYHLQTYKFVLVIVWYNMLYYSTKIIALLCRKTKTDAGILLETTKQEVNKNNEVMDNIQEVKH